MKTQPGTTKANDCRECPAPRLCDVAAECLRKVLSIGELTSWAEYRRRMAPIPPEQREKRKRDVLHV